MAVPGLAETAIAALSMVADGVGEGLVALTVGFAAKPTAIGLALATVLMFALGTVTPVGYQVEALIVASQRAEERAQLLHVVVLAGLVGALLGVFGLFSWTADFIGDAVLNGMLAGVGILLAKAGIDMTKGADVRGNMYVGVTSIAVAALVYLALQDLVYSLVVSVAAGLAVAQFVETESIDVSMEHEEIALLENWKNGLKSGLKGFYSRNVLWGAAALLTLRIGTSIAFSHIDANIASEATGTTVTAQPDAVNIIAGLAGAVSGLFGGAPVEPLISGTAAAPNPQLSGVLFVGLMAVVSFFLLLPKIAKYVPEQAIAGFLFVIGGLVAFPENMQFALESGATVGGVTAVVTAVTDPFVGMVVGLLFKYALQYVGGLELAALGLVAGAMVVARPGTARRMRERLETVLTV